MLKRCSGSRMPLTGTGERGFITMHRSRPCLTASLIRRYSANLYTAGAKRFHHSMFDVERSMFNVQKTHHPCGRYSRELGPRKQINPQSCLSFGPSSALRFIPPRSERHAGSTPPVLKKPSDRVFFTITSPPPVGWVRKKFALKPLPYYSLRKALST